MKAGWKTEELNTNVVFVDYRGKTPPKVKDGIRLITAKNVKMGFIQRDPLEFIDPGAYASWMTRGFPKMGDVLFTTEAPLGNVAQLDTNETVVIGQRLITMQPDESIISSKFLSYALQSPQMQQELQKNATGATVLGIKAKLLKKIPFSYPCLEEQKRIVVVLEKTFAALDRAQVHAEANLKNARELFASIREQKLSSSQSGWSVEQLGSMIDIKHGFAFKSEYFRASGDYVLLTPGNYFEDGGYRDRGAKQKYYSGDIPDGFILDQGDMLVAMTEQAPGLLGSCILIPENDRFLHNQRLGLIEPKSDFEWYSPFYSHVFNLRAFRRALSDTCSGIKVRHTSPKKIYEVSVPVPPTLKDQVEVASFLDEAKKKLLKVEQRYEQKLHDLQELRQSLLQKAFAGELT